MERKNNGAYEVAKLFGQVVKNKNLNTKIKGKRAVSLIKNLIYEEGRNPEDLKTILLALRPNETFELYVLFDDNRYNEILNYSKKRIASGKDSFLEGADYRELLEHFANSFLKPNYKAIINLKKTYFDVIVSAINLFSNENYVVYWALVDIPLNLIFKCKIENANKYLPKNVSKELKRLNHRSSTYRIVYKHYIKIINKNEFKWLKDLTLGEINNVENFVKEVCDDELKREKYLKLIEEKRKDICES